MNSPTPFRSLTRPQLTMLLSANQRSLPGDGLRIVGSGQHRIARHLEGFGLVWIARSRGGQKAQVHVTANGR